MNLILVLQILSHFTLHRLKQAPSLKRFHVSKMDANLSTSTMQQFVFQPVSRGVVSQHSSVLNYSVLYSAFLF